MLKWPSNTRLKLVEATVMFILHFPVFYNIAFQNIKTTLIKSGLCAFMLSTHTYCSYMEYFSSINSVPQTLTVLVRWMQACTKAQQPDPFQSCSSVSGQWDLLLPMFQSRNDVNGASAVPCHHSTVKEGPRATMRSPCGRGEE